MSLEIKVTRENLIREIAHRNKKDIASTREFYDTFENLLFEHLSQVSEEQDVLIKVFNGVSLTGTYVPEYQKMNNNVSDNMMIPSKIKPKFNITRYYRDRLNASIQ